MRAISLLFILFQSFFVYCQNLELPSISKRITYVTVSDSIFMDKLVSVLQSDSICRLLGYSGSSALKKNYLTVYKGSRIEYNDYKPQYIEKYINDTIMCAIERYPFSLPTIIVVSSPNLYYSSNFETKYKGLNIFFLENFHIDDKPLFKISNKVRTYEFDTNYFNRRPRYIPFIFYNNNLYIEPDEEQWYLLTE